VRHRLIAAGLAALFAVSPAAAVPAQAAPLPAAVSCSGVWVVVDYGPLPGGIKTGCASKYSTGAAALKSTFSVVISDGFVSKIGGLPSNPDPNKAYWSYWHATRQTDGSYSNWSYSTLGADAYHPTKGNAEGWRYQSLSEGKAAPRASAPTATAAEPAPSPTPTKASPPPSKKPTAKATASAPADTKTPTAKPAATTTSATAAPSTSAPAEKGTVPVSAEPAMSGAAAEAPSATVPPPASGTPAGTIAAGVAVIVAAGSLGGWWLLRGRRR